ncbi:MAG: glycosyltransferase family 4 protein [Gammaproteobacteria bacterium]|nr:glycosyltransferase family 4 protein [Gammaproteobacteria bacterium]
MNSKHQRPLGLLVDVSSLRVPLTGVGRYTLEILAQLAQLPEHVELRGFNDYRCYEPDALSALLTSFDGSKSSPSSHRLPVTPMGVRPLAKHVLKRVPGSRQLRARLQNKRIASCLTQDGESIYWQPNFILGESKGPSMVTVYDLSHVRFPNFHPPERLNWLQRGLARSLERSDHVMTVSEFSKAEIIDVYGFPAEKVSVVYPGVADVFHHRYGADKLAVVKKKYNLPAQYLLSLGTFEPRKNLKNLIQAYALLSPCLRKHYPLVLAGGSGWNHRETDKLIRQLQSRGELIRLGYVDQWDLPLLYQAASAFAYVSFYEGFGMPVAEAMASGIPVITSAGGSMEEVALGCAQLVEAEDVHSIAEGLSQVLDDVVSLRSRCDRARQVSKKYSWALSAERLVNTAREISLK